MNRSGGLAVNRLFIAMARARLGQAEEARAEYDRTVAWIDRNLPNDENLRRFRKEAAEVLEIDTNDK